MSIFHKGNFIAKGTKVYFKPHYFWFKSEVAECDTPEQAEKYAKALESATITYFKQVREKLDTQEKLLYYCPATRNDADQTSLVAHLDAGETIGFSLTTYNIFTKERNIISLIPEVASDVVRATQSWLAKQ